MYIPSHQSVPRPRSECVCKTLDGGDVEGKKIFKERLKGHKTVETLRQETMKFIHFDTERRWTSVGV